MNVKKILIAIPIVLLSLFLILLVTPFIFKGKLLEIAKKELNNMLTAEVNFSDLNLSFIRNFPNAYVALEDLSVTGTGDFEGETLAAFKKLSVTVDILSVIRMKNIQVKSVFLDKAEINARILEDGRANWDIMKSTDETAEAPSVAEPSDPDTSDDFMSTLNIALKRFEIRNANLSFRDESSNMEAVVNDLNLLLRGDMAKEIVDLALKLNIAEVSFWLDGIRLLTDAQVGFDSQIAADFKNMSFTLKDNRFNLNEIVLKFEGNAQLPDDDINIDLSFATEKTDFKSLLSLIPVIYMQDFASVQTTGSLTLWGDVKGTLNDTQTPSANINLAVDNAMFKYPDLPKSVDNINIALNAFYDGVVFDRTTLDLNKLNFTIAGNPFRAGLHVKTPESDMQVAADFAGKIDFNSVKDIVPLDDITLNGLLECDITIAGRMSTLEKEQYEDFTADGMLRITGFDFESPDFPHAVFINSTELLFNPRHVELSEFDAIVGSSDLSLKGNLENFIPFIFKGDTVRGNLNLKANNINLNEFMADTPAEKTETVPAESAPLTVIEVPKNIDFAVNADIGRILFDKLNITNTAGRIIVKDGKLQMQRLAMNLLDGSMVLNGEYNTQDMNNPAVDFGMDIRQFDITEALSSFSFLEKILPNPQNYAGKVSSNLTFHSILGEDLSPVLNTINSKGRLQTHNLQIQNDQLFGMLADITKNESLRTPSPGNMNIGFEIKNGRLIVEPMHINVQQTRMEISGDQGLDTTMNYKVNVAVPVSVIGQGAMDLLDKIPGGSSLKELTITGFITGTPEDPNISLSIADMAGSVIDAARTQITEVITERVDAAREQLSEELEKQIKAIIEEAEQQVENLNNAAKQTADRLRAEANTRADKLEEDAQSKSAFEQRLAKIAADGLRAEGETAALKIEQEAARQGASVMEAARKKADELRR